MNRPSMDISVESSYFYIASMQLVHSMAIDTNKECKDVLSRKKKNEVMSECFVKKKGEE